tara:strand:+ start:1721 stop:2434 length:714 start_codon:yes stop_codon:yes gene_type:complete
MGVHMKMLLLIVSIISLNFTFGQSGSSGGLGKFFKNSSVTIGMNQSFYGKDWNELIELIEDEGTDVDKNPFRKLNFTLLNEFEHGILGGVKYLSYGTDYDYSADNDDYYEGGFSYEQKIELKFLKLFITYPLNNGFYFGVEGGYFMEGEEKFKIQGNSQTDNDIDRDMWTDVDNSEFDYGLLGQFYYNINENILATVEGYYGLSKFNENIDDDNGIPNVFHYINLGVTYKFGKKVIK